VLLLSLPLVFIVDYQNQAEIKVRLLFFDLFSDKKPKKNKKKRIKSRHRHRSSVKAKAPVKTQATMQKVSESTQTPPKKKKLEKNIPDLDINLIKMLIDSVANPFKKLIKRIKVTELYIDSITGGSDAAAAAFNFGVQNAAIYSLIAWLKAISTVKVERVNIQPDFLSEDSVFILHCKVKIKIGTVIACALAFFFKFLKLKSGESGAGTPSRQKANLGKSIRIVMD
jgi:hypothetical protein